MILVVRYNLENEHNNTKISLKKHGIRSYENSINYYATGKRTLSKQLMTACK